MKHHVFLVPGFFGFANLGEFYYFAHLADEVEALYGEAGVEVEVTRVHTHPTGSLLIRAQRLYQTLEEVAGATWGPIHVVGHSSGGLDARLLLARALPTPGTPNLEKFVARTRSVLSVATPHRGTPLATFFSGRLGAPMLKALSILTLHTLRFGNVPLQVLLKMAASFTKLDDVVGLDNSFFDQIFRELLGDFSADRRDAVAKFFIDVGEEQSIIRETTPEAIAKFNLAAPDRDDVRRGSVVTCAREPGLGSTVDIGLNPYQQATHALFAAIYRQTAKGSLEIGDLPEAQRRALESRWGALTAASSDGVVPTLSQPWGEVVSTVNADHLDVIGHFFDNNHVPPHVDWLATGTHMQRADFLRVWTDVVRWQLES